MTEYVPAPPGQKVLVTMPDGYRVWPDYYDFKRLAGLERRFREALDFTPCSCRDDW